MGDKLLDLLMEFQAHLFREGIELKGLTVDKNTFDKLVGIPSEGMNFVKMHTPYGTVEIKEG